MDLAIMVPRCAASRRSYWRWRPPCAWAAALCLTSACLAQTDRRWAEMREQMVARAVSGAGVQNARVIRAILDTPRHLFVNPRQRRLAYTDMALPIGEGQTISPPFIVAYMTEQLDPQPTDKVLEIGTGSGYQAAILSPLVAEVYTIEIKEALTRRATAVLKKLGLKNVKTKAGDGYAGWPEFAPFDKIIVTCSPEDVPQALVDQLKEGGRLIIPVGQRYQQTLCLFVKSDGELQREELEATFFVPMTGKAEQLRKQINEDPFTQVVNGNFEDAQQDNIPAGWYYVRQASAMPGDDAPSGKRFLRISNRERGRHAQVLQAVGLDGRRIAQLDVRFSVRSRQVQAGHSQQQRPHVRITFFNEDRKELGFQQLGPWASDFGWQEKQKRFAVPEKTRLAVMIVGMFGAIGSVDFDNLTIAATPR